MVWCWSQCKVLLLFCCEHENFIRKPSQIRNTKSIIFSTTCFDLSRQWFCLKATVLRPYDEYTNNLIKRLAHHTSATNKSRNVIYSILVLSNQPHNDLTLEQNGCISNGQTHWEYNGAAAGTVWVEAVIWRLLGLWNRMVLLGRWW